jgi:hypothetical protein
VYCQATDGHSNCVSGGDDVKTQFATKQREIHNMIEYFFIYFKFPTDVLALLSTDASKDS